VRKERGRLKGGRAFVGRRLVDGGFSILPNVSCFKKTNARGPQAVTNGSSTSGVARGEHPRATEWRMASVCVEKRADARFGYGPPAPGPGFPYRRLATT